MPKPKGMEEYYGYVVSEPQRLTEEETEIAEKRIQELREKIEKANSNFEKGLR